MREVQELRPELRSAIVVNGEARTKLSASAREALEQMGVPVIGSLMQRTTIGETTTGGGRHRREPKGAGAIEMRGVLDAIGSLWGASAVDR